MRWVKLVGIRIIPGDVKINMVTNMANSVLHS